MISAKSSPTTQREHDSGRKLPDSAIQCMERLIKFRSQRPKLFLQHAHRGGRSRAAWTRTGQAAETRLLLDAMQVHTMLFRQKPERPTTRRIYLGPSADIASLSLGYVALDRRAPKQSGLGHGRRGISPQTSHIAELYQTHAVGRKIASTRAGNMKAGGRHWDVQAAVEMDRAASASV
ncbi:hypothetical protein SVAN01_06136 [Stagonosporopsis vannaccii]|nr:hypothetical protein SVAN01_06136 [Stagonosporopsis vannaccii]